MAISTPILAPAVCMAKARRAEYAARCLAEQFAQAAWSSQFADGATPDELACLKRDCDGWLLLARSHRAAARRLARVRRVKRLLGWS
jgi:hypothetical protein